MTITYLCKLAVVSSDYDKDGCGGDDDGVFMFRNKVAKSGLQLTLGWQWNLEVIWAEHSFTKLLSFDVH